MAALIPQNKIPQFQIPQKRTTTTPAAVASNFSNLKGTTSYTPNTACNEHPSH